MTERTSLFGGRYVEFKEKYGGRRVGEVDRVDGKYVIFFGTSGYFHEIGTRTKKASAIKYLQDALRPTYPGGVEFKWNVISVRER